MSVIAKAASGPHFSESPGTSKPKAELPPEIRLAEDTNTLLTSTLEELGLGILLGSENESCWLPLDNGSSSTDPTAQPLNPRVLRILKALGIEVVVSAKFGYGIGVGVGIGVRQTSGNAKFNPIILFIANIVSLNRYGRACRQSLHPF